MPFFASKLAVRDMSAKMHSVTQQVEYVYDAAINYLRENKNNLNYGETEYADDALVYVLRNYGLPLGFRNETIFGQTMSLNITKNEDFISAEIKISGDKLSDVQVAELIRRMDLFARDDGGGNISVFVPVDSSLTAYTDIVLKEEPEDGIFLSTLKMEGFDDDDGILKKHSIVGLGGLGSEFVDAYININETNGAGIGDFAEGKFKKITLFGDKNSNNKFTNFDIKSTDVYSFLDITGSDVQIIQDPDNPLEPNMTVNYVSASTTFFPSLITTSLKANDFIMIDNSINFTAPATWTEIKNNFVANSYTLQLKQDDGNGTLKVNSDIVVIKQNSSSDTLNINGGIEVDDLVAENIVVGDSYVDQLKEGPQNGIKIQISPAGTSVFKDIYAEKIGGRTIANNMIYFIKDPDSTTATMANCSEAFTEKGVQFQKHSLAQHIICQYIYWERLEHRLRVKNKTWH